MMLSKNFSLKELTRSEIAAASLLDNDPLNDIDNTPTPKQVKRLQKLCVYVVQPCRNIVGRIKVTSGFRCLKLNRYCGSKDNSQHRRAEAADLKALDTSNAVLFNILRDQGNFDQLIWEYGNDENPAWVHVSYSDNPRGSVLRCGRIKGKRKYWKI